MKNIKIILVLLLTFSLSISQEKVAVNYKVSSFSEEISSFDKSITSSNLINWLNLELSSSSYKINNFQKLKLLDFKTNVVYPNKKFVFKECETLDCREEFSKKIKSDYTILSDFLIDKDTKEDLVIKLTLFNVKTKVGSDISGSVSLNSSNIEMSIRQEMRFLIDLLLIENIFQEKESLIFEFIDKKIENFNSQIDKVFNFEIYSDKYFKKNILLTDESNNNFVYQIGKEPKNGKIILNDKNIFFIPQSGFVGSDLVEIDYFIMNDKQYKKVGKETLNFEIIKPADKKPIALNSTFNFKDKDESYLRNSYEIVLQANDDNSIKNYFIDKDPIFGTLEKVQSNIFKYMADRKFYQSDGSISIEDELIFYAVDSANQKSNNATVKIEIKVSKFKESSSVFSNEKPVMKQSKNEDDAGGNNMLLIVGGLLLLVLLGAAGGGGGGGDGGGSGGGSTGGIDIGINLP